LVSSFIGGCSSVVEDTGSDNIIINMDISTGSIVKKNKLLLVVISVISIHRR